LGLENFIRCIYINKFIGGLKRFGKNAKCRFFIQDCNKLLKPEEMRPNQTTTNKPTFSLMSFVRGKVKPLVHLED
jgi:hypothetical protein